MESRPAPEWSVSRWFNTGAEAPTLALLRGKVVLLHAFQMLCPGCVQHAVPQSIRVAETFVHTDLVVVGMHTVFEHHHAMGSESLAVYLHENSIRHPVGVDAHEEGHAIPRTMRAYNMQGTPTLCLIDRRGMLRRQHFGPLDDLRLGAEIATLLAEPA